MKIFVSWSGKTSKIMAEKLAEILPCINQSVQTFVSAHDIESGARWSNELAQNLDESSFGILCLTKDNLDSKWLMFEAGALTKHAEGRACSLLLGELSHVDVSAPLSQFQNRSFNKEEMQALIADINVRARSTLDESQLRNMFEKFWPDIESAYQTALADSDNTSDEKEVSRSDRDLLEELILRVRGLEAQVLPMLFENTSSERGYHFNSEQSPLPQPPQANAIDAFFTTEQVPVLKRIILDDQLRQAITRKTLERYTRDKFHPMPVSETRSAKILADLDPKRYSKICDIDDAVNSASIPIARYSQRYPKSFASGTDFLANSLGFADYKFKQRHRFTRDMREAFIEWEKVGEGRR